MATETLEEFNKLFDALSEEEVESFRTWLTENGRTEALEAHLAELMPASEPAEPPIVSFTNIGPLLAAPVVHAPRALRAAAPAANDSGVVLDKTAKANGDGTYTITLEAYATGKSSTVTSTDPVDIVLVLDVSGSMDDRLVTYKEAYGVDQERSYYVLVNGEYQQVSYYGYYDGYYYGWCYWDGDDWHYDIKPKTGANDTDTSHVQFYEAVQGDKKIDALKSAVKSFIDSVNAKSQDSQIAIVKFSGEKTDKIGDETYSEDGYTYNYSQIVKNLTTADTGGSAGLKEAVNKLKPAGATRSDCGMELAQSIITDSATADNGRKKVVIMFTDGTPTSYQQFEETVANYAIGASKAIKDAGATVYTIGVFSGADGTPVSNINSVGDRTNKYMHLVSSNYKDANHLTDTGSASYPDGGKSYFLSAGSSAELTNIFTQITQEVGGSTVTLDSKSYIQDTVTGQFTMPESANAVSFYTMDCIGDHKFDESTKTAASDVTYTVTNNTLTVTGFDFSGNWCGSHNGTYSGKKLIVEFTVTRREGFLGGNDVSTNEEATDGIYNSESASLGKFTSPSVNVPIGEVSVTPTNKNVYLLNGVTADQLKSGATVTVGGVTLDLSKASNANKPYGLEKWQTEYVNITVTVTDEDGKEIPTDGLTSLSDDTEYNITVKVTPNEQRLPESSGKAATEEIGEGNGKIKVFKPELTFKDSTAYYGDAVPDLDGNCTKTEWKHGNKLSTAVTMTGDMPRLDITCEPETSKISDEKINTMQDIGVDVTVKIGSTDVTDKTTFHHTDCEDQTCTLPQGMEFLIHVKSCTLTIEKKGWDEIDENQSFVFNVTDAAGNSVTRVVIAMVDMGSQTSKSVTIKGLKAGTYAVTEDTGWSWRYEPEKNGQTVTLTANTDNGTVTFTNEREKDKWLSGDAYAKNVFDYFKKSN